MTIHRLHVDFGLQKHVGESLLTVFCFCGSKYQSVLLVQFKTFTSTSVGVLDPLDQIEVLVKVIVLCVKCTRYLQVLPGDAERQLLSVIVTAT